MILSHWLKATLSAAMFVCAMPGAAAAQDMLRFLDLKSDDFTKAEMTRTEIEAALAAAGPATRVDQRPLCCQTLSVQERLTVGAVEKHVEPVVSGGAR